MEEAEDHALFVQPVLQLLANTNVCREECAPTTVAMLTSFCRCTAKELLVNGLCFGATGPLVADRFLQVLHGRPEEELCLGPTSLLLEEVTESFSLFWDLEHFHKAPNSRQSGPQGETVVVVSQSLEICFV